MEMSEINISLALNIWIFLLSAIGSGYGIYSFFKPHKAVYLQMITTGIMCLMCASFVKMLFLFVQEGLNRGFHIGFLGITGSFLFFFSANFGQMDGLVDDRSKKFLHTRIKALLAPIVILALYIIFFVKVKENELRVVVGFVTLFIMMCTYFNFKHIIIYDVSLGIVKSLKKYNVLILIYGVLTELEFIGEYCDLEILYVISCISIGIVSLLILPVLKRGVEKWTI